MSKLDRNDAAAILRVGILPHREDSILETLGLLGRHAHANAVDKGFWDTPGSVAEHIALMHSELSEMLEGERHGNPPSDHIPEFSAVEEEAADVLIRLLDNAQARGWRLGPALIAKMRFNATRERKHGKAF